MRYWLGVLAFASAVMLEAQTLTGSVYDRLNNEPLVGASISIHKTNTGTTTNQNGRYTFGELVPGRISLVVTYVGYEPVLVENVWLKAGKITEQNVYLERSSGDLEEVVVSAPRPMIEPGRIAITEEQINRIAATYYDPARLIVSSPDVAVSNDQNNSISVRGLSPAYNVWKLEGAEIVNPNHLSNAGTFLDQPTATGGGVNMLSAQMLGRSEFLYSTFGTENGNSVGGIFNMNLREGTDQERQYTAQASLIGFDLMAEGPFRQGGKATYAANYRYSFTGLLAGMGVDFGGESIGFQDLSFNVSTPTGDRSKLKVLGVGGLSYNHFDHKTFEESEVQKDRRDIYYDNQTGVVGATWETGYYRGSFNLGVVFSTTNSERNETVYNDTDDEAYQQNVDSEQSILSMKMENVSRAGNGEVKVGIMQNFYTYRLKQFGAVRNPDFEVINNALSRPYLEFSSALGSGFNGYLGVSAALTNGDQSVEPRAGMSVDLGEKNVVSLGAGVYSMLLNPFNYYFNAGYGEIEFSPAGIDYDLLRSYRGTLGHDVYGADWYLHTEVFYYYFPEVNDINSTEKEPAFTSGISSNFQKDFSRSAYLNIGASWFDSEVEVYENYFNSQYSFTLSAGKEWDLSNEAKNRRLSVDLRGMYQGGFRPYMQINEFPNSWPVNYPSNYTDQRSYLRFDLRLVWKRYHENRTTSIALDLQNVANIENFAYQYYDGFKGQWEVQNQLGLIPILAYRVEW